MNSHASLSCLLAVIANFIPEAAVSGARIVSRLAIMAYRNSNLLFVLKKAVSAGSKITDPITFVIKIPPIKITAGDSVMEIQCCEPNVIFTNEERHMFCQSMNDHMLCTVYRCHDVTLYDDGNPENVTVVYWTLVKTAWYQLTFLALTIFPFCLMVISALVYHLSESFEHSRCVENLTKSIALPFSPKQSDYRLSQILYKPVKLYKNKWQIHLFDELLSLMMVMKLDRNQLYWDSMAMQCDEKTLIVRFSTYGCAHSFPRSGILLRLSTLYRTIIWSRLGTLSDTTPSWSTFRTPLARFRRCRRRIAGRRDTDTPCVTSGRSLSGERCASLH